MNNTNFFGSSKILLMASLVYAVLFVAAQAQLDQCTVTKSVLTVPASANETLKNDRIDNNIDWTGRRAVTPNDNHNGGQHLGNWPVTNTGAVNIDGSSNGAWISNTLNAFLWEKLPNRSPSHFWNNKAAGDLVCSMSCDGGSPRELGRDRFKVHSQAVCEWNYRFLGGAGRGHSLTQTYVFTLPSGKKWTHTIKLSAVAPTERETQTSASGQIGGSFTQAQNSALNATASGEGPSAGIQAGLSLVSQISGSLAFATTERITQSNTVPVSESGTLFVEDVTEFTIDHTKGTKSLKGSVQLHGNAQIQTFGDFPANSTHEFEGRFAGSIAVSVDHKVEKHCSDTGNTGSGSGGGFTPSGGATPGAAGGGTGNGFAPSGGQTPGGSGAGSNNKHHKDEGDPSDLREAIFWLHVPNHPTVASQEVFFGSDTIYGGMAIVGGPIRFKNIDDATQDFEAAPNDLSPLVPSGTWICKVPISNLLGETSQCLVKMGFDANFAPQHTTLSFLELIGDPVTVQRWPINWHSSDFLRKPIVVASAEDAILLSRQSGVELDDLTLTVTPGGVTWSEVPQLSESINGLLAVTMMPAQDVDVTITVSWAGGSLEVPVRALHDPEFTQ